MIGYLVFRSPGRLFVKFSFVILIWYFGKEGKKRINFNTLYFPLIHFNILILATLWNSLVLHNTSE